MGGVPSMGVFIRNHSSDLLEVRIALRNIKNLTATDVILNAADFLLFYFKEHLYERK